MSKEKYQYEQNQQNNYSQDFNKKKKPLEEFAQSQAFMAAGQLSRDENAHSLNRVSTSIFSSKSILKFKKQQGSSKQQLAARESEKKQRIQSNLMKQEAKNIDEQQQDTSSSNSTSIKGDEELRDLSLDRQPPPSQMMDQYSNQNTLKKGKNKMNFGPGEGISQKSKNDSQEYIESIYSKSSNKINHQHIQNLSPSLISSQVNVQQPQQILKTSNTLEITDDFDQVDSSSIGDGDKSKPKEFIIKKQIQRNPSNAHIYSKNLSNINIYNINNAGGTENNRLDENSTSSNQNSQIQHQQQQQPYFNTFNQQKVQQQIGVVQKQQQQNQQQQQQQQFRVSQQQWIKPSRQMSKRQQIRNQHSVKENQATRNQQSQFQQEGGQQFYNSNQSMNPYVQQNQNAGQYGISVQKPSTFKRQVTQNQDNQIYQQQHQQSNYAENPSSIKIQQKRVARNTVYGVSFMDSAKQNQALANTEYEQMSKAGSRASALRPYHRQLKQSIGGTNQIPALSSNQNNPSTFQQSQINQQQQQQYGARPSESQQRVRIHRLNSAMEDVDGVINKQGIPGMMHQNEEFTQMNRRLIHQSQSSSNFPQPRAFTNANSNQPNIVYANFSAGQQELNNGSSMIQNDQAFRISINKEDKVKNHLTKEVNPNMNLMFYDFNDYGQSSKTTSANQPLASQSQSRPQQQPIGDRLPSRQNQTRGSRRGMRDSQSKFYEQISNMNSDFSQRLGSPFPNFQKRAKVILPSIQLPNGSQQSQIGGNILSQGSKAGISYHNIHHKQQNSNHSPKRNASIGIVMEMINEEDF